MGNALTLPTAAVPGVGSGLWHPLAFYAPSLRATIETAICVGVLVAARSLHGHFSHTHRARDLLLFVGVLTLALVEITSYALPAMLGHPSAGLAAEDPVIGTLVAAIAFASAAFAPEHLRLTRVRLPIALAVAASITASACAVLVSLVLAPELVDGGPLAAHGPSVPIGDPLALVLATAAALLFAVAAVRFLGSGGARTTGVAGLFGAASLMLAAERFCYLATPSLPLNWVDARDGLRCLAATLVLAAVLRGDAEIRRAVNRSVAADERRRLARDLHDGLAQDLAFIAAHGDRTAMNQADQHRLAVAARHALAISRGVIADLSASDAPTTAQALQQIAAELGERFSIQITVNASEVGIDSDVREQVVRIAREAIVNAAKHGSARNVTVSLRPSAGGYVLRVRDDGCRVRSLTRPRVGAGFGMRMMTERAASIGGRLTTRLALDGGTELEVVVR